MHVLLKSVLKKIKPTPEEQKLKHDTVDEITDKIKKFDVNPILVGSLAKNTNLRKDDDIDLFIGFQPEVERKELEERGLEIGKKVFEDVGADYEIDYAEHPYVKGIYKGQVIEIVPCYQIAKIKVMSAVDRTPYHTSYVRKKIRADEKLGDEIRLLKQFMKGIEVYGAEAKVEGFSGYLSELLVIRYGSFKGVLEAASGWKFREVIDVEGCWAEDGKAKGELIRNFFPGSPLIVADPVDKHRNVAAAVFKQKMAEFMVGARQFLKNPDEKYFFPQEEPLPVREEIKERLVSRGSKLIAISISHPEINANTLYTQLRKTRDAISRSIKHEGFQILKQGFWTNERNLSAIVYEFAVWHLPNVKRSR